MTSHPGVCFPARRQHRRATGSELTGLCQVFAGAARADNLIRWMSNSAISQNIIPSRKPYTATSPMSLSFIHSPEITWISGPPRPPAIITIANGSRATNAPPKVQFNIVSQSHLVTNSIAGSPTRSSGRYPKITTTKRYNPSKKPKSCDPRETQIIVEKTSDAPAGASDRPTVTRHQLGRIANVTLLPLRPGLE